MPGGYRSDCTRTYVIGEASADYSAAFEVLRHAQESSVAFVNGQRTCESIDAHARGLMHHHHLDGRPPRRLLHSPDRSWDRARESRRAVPGRRQYRPSQARHGLQYRTGLLRARTLRCPDRGHRGVHRGRATQPEHFESRSDADSCVSASTRTLLVNAEVYSSSDPFATALMIDDGVITWVGDDAGARVHTDLAHRVVDLEGAFCGTRLRGLSRACDQHGSAARGTRFIGYP